MIRWDWARVTARWLRSQGWVVVDITEAEELIARREGLDVAVVFPVGMRPTAAAAQQLAALAPGGAAGLSKSWPSPPVSTRRSQEEDT